MFACHNLAFQSLNLNRLPAGGVTGIHLLVAASYIKICPLPRPAELISKSDDNFRWVLFRLVKFVLHVVHHVSLFSPIKVRSAIIISYGSVVVVVVDSK